MAKFTEQRTPYELLVRWGIDGQIQGAHVGFLDTVYKDGEVLTQNPSNVESIAMGESNGFPLSDILDQVLTDSLKEMDELRAENIALSEIKQELEAQTEVLRAESSKVLNEKQSLEGEKLALITSVSDLTAELLNATQEIERLKAENSEFMSAQQFDNSPDNLENLKEDL